MRAEEGGRAMVGKWPRAKEGEGEEGGYNGKLPHRVALNSDWKDLCTMSI